MTRILLPLLFALAVPGWGQTAASLRVRIERVENTSTPMLDLSSASPLTVEGIGFIRLSGATGDFWAPFSLENFKRIKANKTSRRQFDATHPKQRIELSSLLWGRMIDALWPFRSLGIVPSGRYEVSVVIAPEDADWIESNKLHLDLPTSGQEAKPYRFGHFAANMKPEVLTAVLNAATAQGRQPWALFAEWGPVMIEPHTQAFYPPRTSKDRVRRGAVQTFRCSSTALPSDCLDWEPVGTPRSYVQIAEKAAFTKSLRPRSPGETPIMLTGTFSGTDLLSLVEYVRSGRSVLPAFAMCGNDPIWKIERDKQGAVSVIFSNDSVGGCTATMRHPPGQWEVDKCGCWVS